MGWKPPRQRNVHQPPFRIEGTMSNPFGGIVGGLACGTCGIMAFWNGISAASKGEYLAGAMISLLGIVAVDAGLRIWADGLPPKSSRPDTLKMPGSEPKQPPSWWEV
jgi:hypothetical protein